MIFTAESLMPILLMVLGLLVHWLALVNRAGEVAASHGQEQPSFRSYWLARPASTWLSIVSLVSLYFIVPEIAKQWPDLAKLIGSTPESPLNPLAAFLAGYVAPSLADLSGKRLSIMTGGAPLLGPPDGPRGPPTLPPAT